MEKGVFAKYKNKTYRVSNIDKKKIRLVSEDKEDINNGFTEKIYPGHYQNEHNLPKIYINQVERSEIEELHEIEYNAKYRGNEFNLSFNKANSVFKIGTTNAELAKENGLERTDKYYYEKQVELFEIEIIKKKKII